MSSENNQDKDNSIKLLIIGESNVGKTCVIKRFVEDKFVKYHLSTIGVDYSSKMIHLYDQDFKLKIWDTAGQERYHNITPQFYKGADGIIICYSVDNEESFSKVEEWLKQIKSNIQIEQVSLILIGNKCDIKDRIISKEKGEKFAEDLNISYFDTSALSGEGVNEAITRLAKNIVKRRGMKCVSRNISLMKEDFLNKNDEKKVERKCCF